MTNIHSFLPYAEKYVYVYITEVLNPPLQTKHTRYLEEFVQAQAKYYSECHQTMQELQRELTR